jgi:hypothetical protein
MEYGYGVTDVVERYLTLGLALGRPRSCGTP